MTTQKPLQDYYEDGWWIKVSPLARIFATDQQPNNWIVSVYKRGELSWTTEDCKECTSPNKAYEWAETIIHRREGKAISPKNLSPQQEPGIDY